MGDRTPAAYRRPPARCPARCKFTGIDSWTDAPYTRDGNCSAYRPCGFWYGFGRSWFDFAARIEPWRADSYLRMFEIRLRAGALEPVVCRPPNTRRPRQTGVKKMLLVRGAAGARAFIRRFVRIDPARASLQSEQVARMTYDTRDNFRSPGARGDESARSFAAPFYDWSKLVREYAGVEFRSMRAAVRALARDAQMDPKSAVAIWEGVWVEPRPGTVQTPPDTMLWAFGLGTDSSVVWDPAVFAGPPRLAAFRKAPTSRWTTRRPRRPAR